MSAVGVTPRVRASTLLARDWDAIVVGAGIGGLVTAALLATRARMKVLVLERHYELGGLTQPFRRRRYAWEVGVHYVGDVGGGMVRRLMDVVCGGRVRWARLPDAHDRLVAPGIDARFGGGREAIRAQWLALARGEERAADRLLDALTECARAAPPYMMARMRRGAVPSARAPFRAYADRTAAEVIADTGASPLLTLLASYPWTDFGSPPEVASFAALAIIYGHYLSGAYHPVGGGAALPRAMASTIDAAGGQVVVRGEVAHARVEGGRVRGVVLADGTEVRAPIVVSDVGARGTFEWLAPQDEAARAHVRAIGPSAAHVALYLGLAREPRALGLDGANVFIVRDAPGEALRDWADWVEGRRDEPAEIYVSTACAVDPSFGARFPGRAALTLASQGPHASFARWAGSSHGHRDGAYAETKARLGASMLRMASRHLRLEGVEHVEVSTSLSTRHFTNHGSGEIYGLAPTPLRFREGPGPHTSIGGLYLTGQDVWNCGVVGAALGGALAASAITQRDLFAELALGG